MPLNNKSDAQISDLLTDYGIKHGPVVSSTRSLYERKLEEAMANDRTFYREEEEEILDIVCRRPGRKKTSAQFLLSGQNGDQPPDQAEDVSVKTSHRITSHNKLEVKGPIRRQSAGKSRMVIPAVLLLLIGLAAGCYYALLTVM